MSSECHFRRCMATAIALLPTIVIAGEPVAVRSRTFDVEYRVNATALPLDSVQLWYTLDHGATWTAYGFDEDRQSPFLFTADREGRHGFFFVVHNATGPSSPPPTEHTEPLIYAFVDYSPAVVQLHPLQQTTMLGQRVVQVRWTAMDANFGPRPMELLYQRIPDEHWHSLTSEPLANTGRFDWRVPEELSSGPIAIRLTATDQGGHRVTSDRQVLELTGWPPVEPATHVDSPDGNISSELSTESALHGSARATEQAAKLFTEALACRDRGELREAVAHLREAVRLNPQAVEAFVELGDVLYRIGNLDRSLNAYELALRGQPNLRAALRGAARVHSQRKNYATADRLLRTVLRYDPQDAEVWMNLGDIAVYQGDEVVAREAYLRASQVDPAAAQVIADAKKRLELMNGVSRSYRPKGP